MLKLKNTWKGSGQWAPVANALNAIASRLNNVVGTGGVDVFVERDRIEIRGGAGAGFSGSAHLPGGHTVTGLASETSKPWIVWNRASRALRQEAGPKPYPCAADDVWIPKASVKGDLVVWT